MRGERRKGSRQQKPLTTRKKIAPEKPSPEIAIGVRRIEASRSQLVRLVNYLQKTRENERARLASKIHNELMQDLTVISLEVSLLHQSTEEDEAGPGMRRFKEALKRIERVTTQLISASRALAAELRPTLLGEFGLMPALEALAESFQLRTGISCGLEASGTKQISRGRIDLELFRLVEGILAELEKDRTATRALILVTHKNRILSLEVRHNGTAPGHGEETLNFLSMQMTIVRFKGTVEVNREGELTRIRIKAPIRREPDESPARR